MARNEEPCGHRKGFFIHALPGLLLSTGGILLQEPLLSSSLKGHDGTSIFLPVLYAYLFLLNPLTFHLNVLLLPLHAMRHAGASEANLPVFPLKHLPRVARTVSFFNLLFATPLWIHLAVTEESVFLAIGASLVCLATVSTLTSVMKKLLIYSCHAYGSSVPALLSLCVSTALLIFFDTNLCFSNTNRYDFLVHTALHYLLFFVTFVIFMLGVTLLILRISAPAEGSRAAIPAEYLATIALSMAFATLLVVVYLKEFLVLTDMAPVCVEADKIKNGGYKTTRYIGIVISELVI